MLVEFANALTTASQKLAQDATQGKLLRLDDGVLSLLNPTPPSTNGTFSLESVAAANTSEFYEQFRALDIPNVLNASACPTDKFQQCARAVHDIGLYLHPNTTEQEWSILQTQASNAIDLQLQGVALAAIQWRFLQDRAERKCARGAHLPDINNNAADKGISMAALIAIGISIVLVIISCVVTCICCCRRRGRCCFKRQIRLRSSSEGGTSLIDQVP